MNTNPLFVVCQAGAGDYFENGGPVSHHKSRAEADAALVKYDADRRLRCKPDRVHYSLRVEDWTPTAAQVEAWREAQE